MKAKEDCSYLIGMLPVVDVLLLLLVTTVALVNDARKFDVNCEASALISIAETLISGPTKRERNFPIPLSLGKISSESNSTCHDSTDIRGWLLS